MPLGDLHLMIMMMMMVATMAMAVMMSQSWAMSEQREKRGMRLVSGDDVTLTGDLLWHTSVTSLVSCVVLCVSDPACVCFTVAKATAGWVECWGHGSLSPQGGVPHPGARLYLLPPPPPPCPSTPTLPPSSDTTAVAVLTSEPDCSDSDLQSTFLAYPRYMVIGFTITGYPKDLTLAQCQQACVDMGSGCRSVDYKPKQQKCWPQHVAKLDASAEWSYSDQYSYHQRTCA
ncbi:hypothetical protein ACOMHN_065338 [Nucella lapillus]